MFLGFYCVISFSQMLSFLLVPYRRFSIKPRLSPLPPRPQLPPGLSEILFLVLLCFLIFR